MAEGGLEVWVELKSFPETPSPVQGKTRRATFFPWGNVVASILLLPGMAPSYLPAAVGSMSVSIHEIEELQDSARHRRI